MDDEEDNKVDMGDVDFRYNVQFTIHDSNQRETVLGFGTKEFIFKIFCTK